MRGPTINPVSMAVFSPNTGPPTSRTVVKPRISVSVASTLAAILLYPTSPTIAWAGFGRISIACQCASIRPGISVSPPPAITVVPGSASIGAVEMRSKTLPLMRTLDGVESEPLLPSKIRTFWNSVVPPLAGGLSCGWTADASPRAMSESAATTNRLDTEFMQAPRAREFRYRVLSTNTWFRGAIQWRVASNASLPCVDFVADRGHDGGYTANTMSQMGSKASD